MRGRCWLVLVAPSARPPLGGESERTGSSPFPRARGAAAASVTQTTSIYPDANVISPQRSFWNNLHRNRLYMLNEKCPDFREQGLSYNPTPRGSALFTLFIKRENTALQPVPEPPRSRSRAPAALCGPARRRTGLRPALRTLPSLPVPGSAPHAAAQLLNPRTTYCSPKLADNVLEQRRSAGAEAQCRSPRAELRLLTVTENPQLPPQNRLFSNKKRQSVKFQKLSLLKADEGGSGSLTPPKPTKLTVEGIK